MFTSIGICGTGNMGKAIIQGLVGSGLIGPEHIYIYNIHKAKAEAIQQESGVTVVDSAAELVKQAKAVILAVKPNSMGSVLTEIKDVVQPDTVVISIAAGLTIERLAAPLPQGTKIIRVMPNTPALVGEGMSALAVNETVTEDEKDLIAPDDFESRHEAIAFINLLGNCSLLDKSFNISKSDEPMRHFLEQVHEFKDGKVVMAAWEAALSLNPILTLPDSSAFAEIKKAIQTRDALIRKDLIEFIGGQKHRVD